MKTFGQQILDYHFALRPDWNVPEGVEIIYPYDSPETRAVMEAFYHKYYDDQRPRTLILGINPGRFGAGVTGVPFTDPIRLQAECGIDNGFAKKAELSSIFVYDVVAAYGGPTAFYDDFYVTSLSPLGFLKDGKNYNYYDRRDLAKAVQPYVVRHIGEQLAMGGCGGTAICWGEGQNFKHLQALNEQHGFFERILPLSHPRYIMQYRRRYLDDYRRQYLDTLREAVRHNAGKANC